MAIKLRANEEVKIKADFHWSSYLVYGIWAILLNSLAFIGLIVSKFDGGAVVGMTMVFFVGSAPIIFRILENLSKNYSVTNQRLYVEEGILSKTKKDIPLQKINDLEVTQRLFQRLVGGGDLLILTGNDMPTKLMYFDDPEMFKDAISEALNHNSTNRAIAG